MKIFSYLFFLSILTSCNAQSNLTFDYPQIEKIEVYQGYPGTKINMKEGFEQEFIRGLNESKDVGPTKYMKTHRLLIHHINGEIDTILTNGTIHQYKGWYKSKTNLIEKYSIGQGISFSDTIQGQLKTAERLKLYMHDKKYDDAILLFSLEQQENIIEVKKNKEMFEYWCMTWTFDKAKYERYVSKIKEGKAHFIFENKEWKINEK